MKNNTQPKKSSDRTYQFRICLWIAFRKTDKQIQDLLKEKFNIDMSIQNINDNYRRAKRWQKVITYLRTRFLNNVSRIPIANKAYRLALLQEAAEEALTWHIKNVNEYGIVREKKLGVVAQLTKEARTEIEGEKSIIDQSKHFHFTNFNEFVANAYRNREKTVAIPDGDKDTSRLPS